MLQNNPIFLEFFYESKGGMFSLIRCSKTYVDAASLGTVRFVEEGHGLRTPSEGINQRNLKIWADAADKICFGRT